MGTASAAPLGQPLTAFAAAPSARFETIQFLPGSGFPNPRMRGAVVDWCSTWSNNCGPAARPCSAAHTDVGALSWDVIEAGHTYVIGSGGFCEKRPAARRLRACRCHGRDI
jgi:hypothetical protein